MSTKTTRFHLALLVWHPVPWISKVAAGNPKTPLWAVRPIRRRRELAQVIVSRKDISYAFLSRIARDPKTDEGTLMDIANHKKADFNILKIVLNHPKAGNYARMSVLSNPHADSNLIRETLSCYRLDSEYSIYRLDREYAINNGRIYAVNEVLEKAAAHVNCPEDILRNLAETSTSQRVLSAVMENPSTQEEIAVLAALRAASLPD